MKFIRKFAEFIGYVIYHDDVLMEWRCPNKNCGMSVAEEYVCCPYCGQKIKFDKRIIEADTSHLKDLAINDVKYKIDIDKQ